MEVNRQNRVLVNALCYFVAILLYKSTIIDTHSVIAPMVVIHAALAICSIIKFRRQFSLNIQFSIADLNLLIIAAVDFMYTLALIVGLFQNSIFMFIMLTNVYGIIRKIIAFRGEGFFSKVISKLPVLVFVVAAVIFGMQDPIKLLFLVLFSALQLISNSMNEKKLKKLEEEDKQANFLVMKYWVTLALAGLSYGVIALTGSQQQKPREDLEFNLSVDYLLLAAGTIAFFILPKRIEGANAPVMRTIEESGKILFGVALGAYEYLMDSSTDIVKITGILLMFSQLSVRIPETYRLFVADKEDVLPTSSKLSEISKSIKKRGKPVGIFKHIMENKDTRNIAIYLSINLTFMFVELVYGVISNSLGLISDAAHMFFDCMALFIGLYASYVSKFEPNEIYTYGYNRFEVLSGFFNGLFLVIIALNVLIESIERLIRPQSVKTEGLLIVSVLGFCVNLVGLFCFHDHSHGGHDHHHHAHKADSHKEHKEHELKEHKHSHKKLKAHNHDHHENHTHDHHENHTHDHHDDHTHDSSHSHLEIHDHSDHKHTHSPYNHSPNCSHDHHNHNHSNHKHDKAKEKKKEKDHSHHHHDENENLYGIFLHILADTLGSVGVITSSILMMYFNWTIADPICSFSLSTLILISVIPLLKSSADVLLQKVPSSFKKRLQKIKDGLNKVDGLLEYKNLHVWAQKHGEHIGTIEILMRNTSSKDKIIDEVKMLFQKEKVRNVTVQIFKEKRSLTN